MSPGGVLGHVRGWVGRVYLKRLRRRGFTRLGHLPVPEAARFPLRRDGLDPVPELGRVRAEQPVSRLPLPFGMTVWLVTGYPEAKAVLADDTSFSNDFANLGAVGLTPEQDPGGLGFRDPPEHSRLRRMLMPEFTIHRLRQLAPRIDSIVADRLDRMSSAPQPVDLVREFALPIPSLLICELLDVPYADRADFQRLAMARFDVAGGTGASIGAVSESLRYLRGLARRQRAAPTDGMLGRLVRRHGDELDDDELTGLADGLLTGGFETTASMLALGALAMLRDPVLFGQVAGGEDEVHRAVEELLRHLSVVQITFPRFARTDVTIGATVVAKGDVVLCSLSGANRDPVLGEDMEHLVPGRAPTQHLAFSHGVHRCLGAELARMELRIALPALAHRFPRLRLAVPPEELSLRELSLVHGVDALPVYLG
ncbi:cytochrome P450 [Actinophytocola oryzae]|uniref:Cytochrome P450 n=1 Tax=Actinophytocola oryzae TaxID=502181 RepID=A0A4R7V417_9PSEU|nr:cytochrome P450 [Actinophytocola oryzae]TDV44143.1 cytochrome P450 [Actinophytocola oryzae]